LAVRHQTELQMRLSKTENHHKTAQPALPADTLRLLRSLRMAELSAVRQNRVDIDFLRPLVDPSRAGRNNPHSM
jgi:hypothetical protein